MSKSWDENRHTVQSTARYPWSHSVNLCLADGKAVALWDLWLGKNFTLLPLSYANARIPATQSKIDLAVPD